MYGLEMAKKSLLNQREEPNILQARAVFDENYHYFFGYYDNCPWESSQRYFLYLRVSFANRWPKLGEAAEICLVDLKSNERRVIAKTKAWCWQQGCRLQWLGGEPEQLIIFNDFQAGKYLSVIIDRYGTIKKVLPQPIYAVTKNGSRAVSLNFGRLHYGSPGYGYIAKPYIDIDNLHPEDDGLWHMDIETGKYKLIISLDQIVKQFKRKGFENNFHYFNHLEFNPSGTRFVFLHRWFKWGRGNSKGQEFTRMFTAKPDGSDLYLLADHGMVSHFTWKDDTHLLAWAYHPLAGCSYYLFEDQTEKIEVIGHGILTEDGHPSYSPDGRWILTDTYPDALRRKTLILFDNINSKRIDLGRYFTPFAFDGPFRCDLHPRWSHDGRSICFDSVHERKRRVYVVNVSSIVMPSSK